MRVSGGGFESDGVAEGFELAYVVALASFGVDSAMRVASARSAPGRKASDRRSGGPGR